MRIFLSKKSFLICVGIFAFALLFFGNASSAQAAFPQNEKTCTVCEDDITKCRGEGSPYAYACTNPPSSWPATANGKEKSIAPISINGASESCFNSCFSAGGTPIYYGDDLYCYGATSEVSCNVGDVNIGVQSGQQTPAEESCGYGLTSIGCWLSNVLGALLNIGATILNTAAAVIAKTLQYIAFALAGAMNLFIKYFMSIPVSPSSDQVPGFVRSAWDIMRQFVNSFFVLILALIGFATILRVQSYQFQKTLPALVIIVLLINFSGVLVGLVVDISNIITNYFLTAANAPPWENGVREGFYWAGADALALNVVQIIYYLVSTLIYFAVMLLFALRTIVLWALSIISPIAFAMYILPATRRYWTQWWQQLIQWALLGIPISVFMFLASMVIRAGSIPNYPNAPGGLGGAIISFLAPLTTLFLLFYGITLSMQLAPAGAKGVVSFSKSLPKRLGETRLGQKTLGGAATMAQKSISGIRSGSEKLADRGKEMGGVGGKLLQFTGRTSQFGAAGLNRAVGPKLIEYAASKRRFSGPPDLDKMTAKEKEDWATTSALNKEDLAQFGAKISKDLPHTSKGFRDKVQAARDAVSGSAYLQESVSKINDVFGETVTENVLVRMKLSTITDPNERKEAEEKLKKEIGEITAGIEKDAEANPKLKIELGKMTPQQKRDLAAAKKSIQELKPQDIANVANPKTLAFRLAIADSNPANLQRIMDNFGKDVVDDVIKGTGGLDDMMDNPQKLEEMHERNPRLVRALFTTPAFSGLALEGRNQMLDINDRRTTNFKAFETREHLLKNLGETKLNDETTLLSYWDLQKEIRGFNEQLSDEKILPEEKTRIQEARREAENMAREIWDGTIKNTAAERVWAEFENARKPRSRRRR